MLLGSIAFTHGSIAFTHMGFAFDSSQALLSASPVLTVPSATNLFFLYHTTVTALFPFLPSPPQAIPLL